MKQSTSYFLDCLALAALGLAMTAKTSSTTLDTVR